MVDGAHRFLRRVVASSDCLLCAGPADELVCGGCRDELPWNRIACPRCAQPLKLAPSRLCASCQTQPPPFDRAIAAFRYRDAVAGAVQSLKYNANFLSARWLGVALAESVHALGAPLPQRVLPVPLHAGRLRRRGFNQAQELARIVGRQLHIAIEPTWTRRLLETADQIGLDASRRRRNVKDAFAVDARVAGLSVALLDDVMTTGSTLAELARACRKAGAVGVEVWTAARAE